MKQCIVTLLFLWLACIGVSGNAAADNVLLWNKLGSVDEVANSEIGPDGVIVSGKNTIDYIAAKFGNGVRVNGAWEGSTNISFPMNDIAGTQLNRHGTLEFWVKPDHDSHDGGIRRWIDYNEEAMSLGVGVYWRGWIGALSYVFYGGQAGQTKELYVSDINFSAGELLHIAAVWDADGIDGTNDTVRAYINGELKMTSEWTWPMVEKMARLKLGASDYSQYATVDNLIVRDYAKTDFSDRFQENPTGLVLSNTLSSYEAVHNSIAGPNLIYYEYNPSDPIAGIANRGYIPGPNGNAITIAAGSYSNMQRIHNVVLNNAQDYVDPTKGTVQFWYKQNEKPVDYDHGIYRMFGGGYGLGSGIAVQSSVVSGEARLVFALSFGGTSVAAYGEDQKVGYNIDIMLQLRFLLVRYLQEKFTISHNHFIF